MAKRMPMPQIRNVAFGLGLGVDTESTSLDAKPGSARAAFNYEVAFGGGFERVRGFERFDGRPRPSDALYVTLSPVAALTGVVAGDLLTGQTSGASGTVVYAGPDFVGTYFVALAAVTGAFSATETLLESGNPVGVNTPATPAIGSDQDNRLYDLVAAVRRLPIQKPAGSGAIRGIAALGSDVFAWRDNAAGTACEIHKASASGWQVVPLHYVFSFTGGSTAYAEGGNLTQGSVTAVIRRVVLTSGAWGTSNAAGYMVVQQPAGGSGNFANGAAAGSGVCTLTGVPATSALAKQTLLPGGRVETITHNFYGSSSTRRLYGCDGVNTEFEFDGATLVPILTGSTQRATFVAEHAACLWFAVKSSLMKSVAADPYKWAAVAGAAEFAVGADITGLAANKGAADSSSLLVTAENSAHILYGSTTATFKLDLLSDVAGSKAYSLQSIGTALGYDQAGFRLIKPMVTYGNFLWDIRSRKVDSLARDRTPVCSLYSSALSRYRCFFSDGTALSGTQIEKDRIAWCPISLGFTPAVAYSGEVAGKTRTFYGSSDGWVFEADVGRSFDGGPIQCALRLVTLDAGSPMLEKQFRDMAVEARAGGAFTLYASAEFDDGDPQNSPVSAMAMSMPGNGGQWDVTAWDRSRWDAAGLMSKVVEIPGMGYGVAPIFYSNSAIELEHAIRSVTVVYSPLKARQS